MINRTTDTEPFFRGLFQQHFVREFAFWSESQAFAARRHTLQPAEGVVAVSGDHFVYNFISRRRVSDLIEVDEHAEARMCSAEDLQGRIREEVDDVFFELDGEGEEDWTLYYGEVIHSDAVGGICLRGYSGISQTC